MTVTVEIAHIRSEKPRGPRHVPGYEPVHEFENLLLLCLKHHKMVDDNPDVFPIELLEEWKEIQVGQTGTTLDEDVVAALLQQVSTLSETITALTGPTPARTATVQLLAGRGGNREAAMMPLDVYRRVTFEDVPSIVYLGVEIRDHGLLRVRQAGLEFDFGGASAETTAVYLLPSEIFSRNDQHEVRLVDQDRLRSSMLKLGQATARLPLRFRGFVQLDDGRQVSGPWTPMLELPIWRDEITEDDLRRLMRRPSES
ncbi:hypothetical protein ACIA5G_39050 [Amycolatopsis sp. NPDC051758]|uniref:hypothetical protein n=1 Tax=Amycolatopsis sp. NPDC051758 TaxID=3363935 RepID=UPI0037A8C680